MAFIQYFISSAALMFDELVCWTIADAVTTLFTAWAAQRFWGSLPKRPAVQTLDETLYLTRAAGRTQLLTQRERRQHWHRAVQYISRLLRLRRKLAQLGNVLKQKRVKDVLSGIVRQNGTLLRSAAEATPCPSMSVTSSARVRAVTARAQPVR